ncbi:hypothetical protein MKW94_011294 [Papaver nudicaule]|uniref:Uncharacterized protein n=1 Tax=Papaver nudicaule TaxID=74823 RepID=A0AA41SBQ6_PAPNU|nr:hypothetical protein [Papaver nudicaule]
MKIFGWMQSKLNGKQTIATKKPTNVASIKNQNLHEPRKDEFSDWPHALLAIGTFGTKDTLKRDNEIVVQQDEPEEEENTSSSLEDQLDFTPEEVGKLQKELTKLLSRKPVEQTESQRRNGISTLPLDKFLNCPSSLEVDRTICEKLSDVANDNKDVIADLRRSISFVLGNKATKDVCFDGNNNGALKKKSISFLLKKMFVCSSGFAAPAAPSLRDQMQLPESRMEKLLRAILNKKIHQRSSNASTSTKKYLENNNSRHISANIQMELENQLEESESHGSSKWDKTDSEFIVLEI